MQRRVFDTFGYQPTFDRITNDRQLISTDDQSKYDKIAITQLEIWGSHAVLILLVNESLLVHKQMLFRKILSPTALHMYEAP